MINQDTNPLTFFNKQIFTKNFILGIMNMNKLWQIAQTHNDQQHWKYSIYTEKAFSGSS